jgi:hypothetical protein
VNVIFSSGGNDSVALIQWAIENDKLDIVAYSDTQWASKEWPIRIAQVKQWVEDNGGEFVVIPSEGFEALAKRKKAVPTNGMAFCSYELKIKPAQEWLETIDPDKKADCYTGVMRLESEARKDWPEIKEESPNHGGRNLISPMALYTINQRDELVSRAGFELLPHRSSECSPCVNANIKDIQNLDDRDLIKVKQLESDLGIGVRSGKPKYMFRSIKCSGAQGIEQVKAWADQGGGKYSPDQEDMFGCDSGFCGD